MKKIKKSLKVHTSHQRMLWPDVVRIIAIYLVLQVHTTSSAYYPGQSFSILERLGIMGVPLFVLLSGALLLGKHEDYITFFRKRCLKVLIPWIVWTFLYMLYFINIRRSQFMAEFFRSNVPIYLGWFHFFFHMFMSILWFLPMIFCIYLITPILRIIVRHASLFDNAYLLIILFISFSIMPYLVSGPLFPTWEPDIIYAPLQFIGYFILGYVLVKWKVLNNLHPLKLLTISALPFFIFLIPFNSTYAKNFVSGYLSPGTLVASTFFFYFLYSLSNRISKHISSSMKNTLGMISGASFGVYIINGMFLDYFKADLINFLRLFHVEFLLTLLTFIITTIIVIILQKFPLIKLTIP